MDQVQHLSLTPFPSLSAADLYTPALNHYPLAVGGMLCKATVKGVPDTLEVDASTKDVFGSRRCCLPTFRVWLDRGRKT